MFKTRGGEGVRGRLNNVKKTALLVLDGFPYLHRYTFPFDKSHRRDSGIILQRMQFIVLENSQKASTRIPQKSSKIGWMSNQM